ncbi:DUF2815 family protein [Clostridium bovifaecis]|uniref:DUF2815 family protein n=1 Tax=Clostridium bovifaecis TaxID=2184719 RepID=A0A6I6EWR1_9CLOT|nr:DUF2815 family protein [Clostridium bovifaecis]
MRNTKVITGKVRLSYVNVFKPRAAEEGQEPRYSLCILIPKNDKETISKINLAIEDAKSEGMSLWGAITDGLKIPLRDGDEERGDREEYIHHYFLNATSKQKPGIVDRNLKEITDESKVYSGCYGRVSIRFYPFNKNDSKGIGCTIFNVQKLSEGEALGKSRACDDFSIIYDNDDILG